MRKSLLMVGIPVSVLGLGLATFVALRPSNKNANDAFAKELAQADAAGIQLAQSQTAKPFVLNETVPETKPEAKTVIKRGNGTQAVRSKTPSVAAAPTNIAADVVEEIPDLTMPTRSAAPTQVEVVAPVASGPAADPAPVPAQDQGPILRGGNGAGTGAGSAGGGGGWGTIFGAVIRGGGVDGDNCDPRGTRRPTAGGGTYGGNPAGVIIGRTAGSTIRGGGIQLPVGISGARPRGR
jgi:hypothetical protein